MGCDSGPFERDSSITPITGTLLNLHPEIRYTFEYTCLFGWVVCKKRDKNEEAPFNIQMFFSPFIRDWLNAFNHGIKVQFENELIMSKSVMLFYDADMRLRQVLLLYTAPPGIYACPKCKVKGEYVSSCKCMKYPVKSLQNLHAITKRTSKNWKSDANQYIAKQQEIVIKRLDNNETLQSIYESSEYKRVEPVDGIKGLTVLSFLPYLELQEACFIQPLHCIYVYSNASY